MSDKNAGAKNLYLQGMLDTLPLIIAATPFAVLYGALAATYNMSFAAALGMSAIVFAGASQFIAVTLIGSGVPALIIVLTVCVVNLRHMLYAVGLMPHVKPLEKWKRIFMAFWLTDETFAVVSRFLQQKPDDKEAYRYYWGSAIAMYINWIMFTWVGIVLGETIPDLTQWGLDIAMVLAFVAIVVPSLKHKAHIICVVVAAFCAILTFHWPYNTGLLFSSLVAILVGVFVEQFIAKSMEGVIHE